MIERKELIRKLCEEIGYSPEFILYNIANVMDDQLFFSFIIKARDLHPELFPQYVERDGTIADTKPKE